MRLVAALAIVGLTVLMSGCTTTVRRIAASARARSRFIGFSDFSGFNRIAEPRPGQTRFLSPVLAAPNDWDQLVISWNTDACPSVGFKFEVRGIYPGHRTRFYTLGLWSGDAKRRPRRSVNGQHDSDGEVRTDTLVLKRPGASVQVRITVEGVGRTARVPLKLLGLCFCDSRRRTLRGLPPHRRAWGKVLAVPPRSQLEYSGGGDWCSPTSVSMVLAYWAKQLKRPDLDRNVPEVAAGVFDPQWPGTGNWPFNTAYAGAFPGLRAYVTRLTDVSELEDWIADGVPVVLSVLPSLLNGNPNLASTGHLVVCVGFTRHGDPVINDPWAPRGEGRPVRRIDSRKNLIAAWRSSLNTVYLIYPAAMTLPPDPFGQWEGP